MNTSNIKETDRSFKSIYKIYEALIELMGTRNIETITIKSITETAGISRGTFYLYFSDINDVVRTMEKYLIDEMPKSKDFLSTKSIKNSSTLPSKEDCQNIAWEKEFFLYFSKHRKPLNALLGSHGDAAFHNKIKKQIIIELNVYREAEGFIKDNLTESFCSLYADVFLLLGKEWTDNSRFQAHSINDLCSISSMMRIGAQYAHVINAFGKTE